MLCAQRDALGRRGELGSTHLTGVCGCNARTGTHLTRCDAGRGRCAALCFVGGSTSSGFLLARRPTLVTPILTVASLTTSVLTATVFLPATGSRPPAPTPCTAAESAPLGFAARVRCPLRSPPRPTPTPPLGSRFNSTFWPTSLRSRRDRCQRDLLRLFCVLRHRGHCGHLRARGARSAAGQHRRRHDAAGGAHRDPPLVSPLCPPRFASPTSAKLLLLCSRSAPSAYPTDFPLLRSSSGRPASR